MSEHPDSPVAPVPAPALPPPDAGGLVTYARLGISIDAGSAEGIFVESRGAAIGALSRPAPRDGTEVTDDAGGRWCRLSVEMGTDPREELRLASEDIRGACFCDDSAAARMVLHVALLRAFAALVQLGEHIDGPAQVPTSKGGA